MEIHNYKILIKDLFVLFTVNFTGQIRYYNVYWLDNSNAHILKLLGIHILKHACKKYKYVDSIICFFQELFEIQ